MTPSIYDGEDEGDEAPWFLPPKKDVDEPAPAPSFASPGEYDAALLIGRLDEAVRLGAPLERLALIETGDLMWRTRRAVRPERLALMEMDGVVPGGPERAGYMFAAWALRRLKAPFDALDDQSVLGWLGWRFEGAPPEELALLVARRAPEAVAGWAEMAAELSGAEITPLMRAGRLAEAWARDEALGPDREEVALIIGAALSAEGTDLPFAPVSIGARRGRGVAAAAWAEDVAASCRRALGELHALRLWRARAEAFAAPLKARTPRRLIEPLYVSPAITASQAAALADCTRDAADMAFGRLAKAGLVRELTGGERYRFWAAKL